MTEQKPPTVDAAARPTPKEAFAAEIAGLRKELARMEAVWVAQYGAPLAEIPPSVDAAALADLHNVLRWLNGEVEDQDGFSFGDRPAAEPPFWWRRKLKPGLALTSPIALAALASRAQAGDWQDISTAPKDGSKFQSQDRNNYGARVFNDTHWYVHSAVQAWITDEMDCADYEFEPTHWRPAQVGEAEPVDWQWRSRIKGGAWDAWERGRYGQEVPPFMEVEERPLYATPQASEDVVRALADLVEIERRDQLTDPAEAATDWWREQAWENARSALRAQKPLMQRDAT